MNLEKLISERNRLFKTCQSINECYKRFFTSWFPAQYDTLSPEEKEKIRGMLPKELLPILDER